PPSSAATRPAIGSRPTASAAHHRPPTYPAANRPDGAWGAPDERNWNVSQAPATATRRARYRPLCAGQEFGARRRAGVQAVVERDAAWAEPAGDRRLPGGG